MKRYMGGTKLVAVRLPIVMDEDLQQYAKKLGQSKSDLIIEAVSSLLVMFKKEGR